MCYSRVVSFVYEQIFAHSLWLGAHVIFIEYLCRFLRGVICNITIALYAAEVSRLMTSPNRRIINNASVLNQKRVFCKNVQME